MHYIVSRLSNILGKLMVRYQYLTVNHCLLFSIFYSIHMVTDEDSGVTYPQDGTVRPVNESM